MHTDIGNLVRVIVKVILLLILFGFFPVFIAVTVFNYNEGARPIIQQSTALDDAYNKASTSLIVLTQEQADVFQRINQYAAAIWIEEKKSDTVLQIDSDNKFSEWNKEKKIAYGTWRARIITVNEDSSEVLYVFQMNHQGPGRRNSSDLYKIVKLDHDFFTVQPIAQGETKKIEASFDDLGSSASTTTTLPAPIDTSSDFGTSKAITYLKATSTIDFLKN